jgi:uracil-DNA glycosylase
MALSGLEYIKNEKTYLYLPMNKDTLTEAIGTLNKSDWAPILFSTEAKGHLLDALNGIKVANICPMAKDIFRAFSLCPLSGLKVVILGQDPYPNVLHANGLAFSVAPTVEKLPPSLINIFKALEANGIIDSAQLVKNGDLSSWAEQGVLLLNTSLTTIAGQRGSHISLWAPYTDYILSNIAKQSTADRPIIFILWGIHAKEKKKIIKGDNVHILEWGHPSPISEYNKDPTNPKNFLKCDNFTKANNILIEANLGPINWASVAE